MNNNNIIKKKAARHFLSGPAIYIIFIKYNLLPSGDYLNVRNLHGTYRF